MCTELNKKAESEKGLNDSEISSNEKDNIIDNNNDDKYEESKKQKKEDNIEEKQENIIPILSDANEFSDVEDKMKIKENENLVDNNKEINIKKDETLITVLTEGNFFIEMQEVYQLYEKNLIWKKQIVKLCATFNDFLFNYSEVFLKSVYGLNKFRKVFVFEAPNKINEQSLKLKEISDEIISFNEHEDIAPLLSNLVTRNGDMLDIDFQPNIIPPSLKNIFKNSLSTLLLISKILNRQQMQLTALVLETDKIDQNFLEVFYELRLLKEPLLNPSDMSVDIDSYCENIVMLKKQIVESAKIIGESTKLKTSFIKSMQRGVFTAYNEVIRSKKIFEQKIKKISTDFDTSFSPALFDDLLSTIKRYLMDNFNIQPLSVNRGDKFDIDKHNLLTEPEPDLLLENNTIKEVVNYGFQQNGVILLLSDIILVKN